MNDNSSLFERAKKVIPGGVNSPVRAFNSVGGTPVFVDFARGAYLFDSDGKRYIDYIGSWGPMIAGHANQEITEAVKVAASRGLSYGAPTELEVEMAETVCEIVPSMDMVRMVNSGTEATMSAIRLARGFTHRDKIIKFEGCYHGHADALLVKAGSGALTLGVPDSPGVPASVVEHTLIAQYNDLESVAELFERHPDQVACIIVEPVAGNMNCVLPQAGFLQGLRELCDKHQALLIFDEVMTGFRVALGGAQALYNIRPDLTALGKIIGGGLPVGAFGGRADVMQELAPSGPVYQAGTLSGNPIAMTAGLKTLEIIRRDGFYDALNDKTLRLLTGLRQAAKESDIPFTTVQAGGMFGLLFTQEEQISRYEQVTQCDIEHFRKFFHFMLTMGAYLAPSAYEAGFMSGAHSDEDIENTIEYARLAFSYL